ncbi:MAG TPA: GDP-mannose 4,6-dehydratase [Thermoanaerobaculia bacterium]|nr:GDP-mannose 4,6-dehydratase [Thermoanaerobaculia bacterium]
MSSAIIVGSEGQDGRLLALQLAQESYRVIGLSRAGVSVNGASPRSLDIADARAVTELVQAIQPEVIYYVAGHHQSAEDRVDERVGLFAESQLVHVSGIVNFLEAVAVLSRHSRVVYAASSLLFASSPDRPIDETTPFAPASVYAITKAAGAELCRLYRRRHGVKASVAFLFNHESPLRRPDFVSQKIIRAARAIRDGRAKQLVLGDLSAMIDWGWAPDYAEAMIRIARHSPSEDFIVATGELHSVGELVERVFTLAGLDWKNHVEERSLGLAERGTIRRGDSTRLRSATSWKPSVTFGEMVERLWTGYSGEDE